LQLTVLERGKIGEIYKSVEKTHPRLGRIAVLETLCDIANKCLLVIGCSGTGKSAVMKYVARNVSRKSMLLDSITVNGLKHIQSQLSDKSVSILVDDISKGGTEYSQVQTVVALAELSYSGFLKKYTQSVAIDIENFTGSVIINAQPLMLKRILKAPEFETDVRDKVIRYYHLPRPVNPNVHPPDGRVRYSYNYGSVEIPSEIRKNELYHRALENFKYQFTIGRAIQHLDDLLRACATLNEHGKVEVEDLEVVEFLSRNFRLEREIYYKRDLEGPRKLDVNVIPILSIIASYGTRSLEDIMIEFQVRKSRAYEIVKENSVYAQFKDEVLIPTNYAIELLRSIGEAV
jgi:hypothetical protein